MSRLRIILTVLKREITQMVRYPTWVIEFVVWPFLVPLIYFFTAYGLSGPDKSGLKNFQSLTGTTNFLAFITIGTMIYMCVNMLMWGFGGYLRTEQMQGTLESNWLCPVKKIDLLLGGGMYSVFNVLVFTIISIIEYRFIYGVHFSGGIPSWVLLFIITLPGIFGLGMLFASIVLWLKDVSNIVFIVRGIVMMICGISFPISVMPLWIQHIAKALPYTYAIRAARGVMVNGLGFLDVSMDILMCLLEGMVLLILGIAAFKRTEKIVKKSGSFERF